MANPTVEKLKALGLRHGEKAVVGLAVAACVLLLVMAFTEEVINLTPEQVKKSADTASANLSRPQDPAVILQKLQDQFLKKPEFEAMVDDQAKTLLVADNYKPDTLWVTNEPTGGLIRDMPELFAVTALYAYPGRGGVLMFELKNGERIPDEGNKSVNDATKSRVARKRSAAVGGGSMAMMSGAPKKKSKKARPRSLPRPRPRRRGNSKRRFGSVRNRWSAARRARSRKKKRKPKPCPSRNRPWASAGSSSPGLRPQETARQLFRRPESPRTAQLQAARRPAPDLAIRRHLERLGRRRRGPELRGSPQPPREGGRTDARQRPAGGPSRSAPLPQGRLLGTRSHCQPGPGREEGN